MVGEPKQMPDRDYLDDVRERFRHHPQLQRAFELAERGVERAALKQPRITREQIRSIGITNRYAVEHFMRELQLLKVPTEDDEPPEASRE